MENRGMKEAGTYKVGGFLDAKRITVDFIEDVMDFIFYWRIRLESGENTIPSFDEMYPEGEVEKKYEEFYKKAVGIAKEYFKVYWRINDETEDDRLIFDEPIQTENGNTIIGIGSLEEGGVIKYIMATENGESLGEDNVLDNVEDIIKVIDLFQRTERK